MIPLAPILAAALASRAPDQDLGPLATRNHRAVALAFLRFEPAFGVLPRGQSELALGAVAANEIRDQTEGESRVLEDDETLRISVRYRQGLGRDSEWGVEVPVLSRGGGFLDPWIDGWHSGVLRWTDPVRDAAPFGRSVVSLPGSGDFGSAAGLGDVSGHFARRIAPDVSARFAVKLPTGDAGRLLGSGGVDAGLSIDGRRPLGRRWTLYAGLALVAQSPGTQVQGARGLVDQGYFALCYRQSARDTWIAQWQSERAPVGTGVPGADATHRLITFAYRRQLDDRRHLELYFSEDRDLFNGAFPEGANVGPDFTAGVRLIWRR